MQRMLFYLSLGLIVAKILNPGYLNFGQGGIAKNAVIALLPKFNLPVATRKAAPSVVQVSTKCTGKAGNTYRNLGERCE